MMCIGVPDLGEVESGWYLELNQCIDDQKDEDEMWQLQSKGPLSADSRASAWT